MIHLVLHNVPTLHRKDADARAALVAEIKALLRTPLERRIYHVCLDLYGDWFRSNGVPRTNNVDNSLKCLLDCLAEAGGLGMNGRGDEFLDRDFGHIRAHQCETDYVEITLE